MTQAATQARKDFLSVLDFDPSDLDRCLQLAANVKADRALGRHALTADALNGRHLALLFDKPSLRTRARRNAVAASAGVASWNALALNVCDASGMRACWPELAIVAFVGA